METVHTSKNSCLDNPCLFSEVRERERKREHEKEIENIEQSRDHTSGTSLPFLSASTASPGQAARKTLPPLDPERKQAEDTAALP